MRPLYGDGCEGLNEADTAACRECHERRPTDPDKVWTWVIRPDGSMICSEIPAADLPPEDVPDRTPSSRKRSGGGWLLPVVAGVGTAFFLAMVLDDD